MTGSIGVARGKGPRTAAIAAVAVVLAIVALTYYEGRPSADRQYGLFEPDDPEIVARGELVYSEHCASCHGVDLQGEENWRQRKPDGRLPAPPHDETGHTWHHPDQQLFDITKHRFAELSGLTDHESDMPVYGDILSDEEIVAVLSYIKSRWPQELRERHDEMNRRAAAP